MIRRFFGSTIRDQPTGGGGLVSSVYIEAENADFIGANWVNEAFTGASGTILRADPPSIPNPNTTLLPESVLTFNTPQLEAGNYIVWTKVNADNSGQDSIFHRINTSSWEARPSMFPYPAFAWTALIGDSGSVKQWVLSEGAHIFELHIRENGLRLDQIYITKNGDTPV